jgi:hypothetical protein
MQVSPSWEAACCSATQECPKKLWNPKIYYRIRKNLSPVSTVRRMDPVHTTPTCFSNIHFNIIFHRRLGLPTGLFSPCFPTKNLYVSLLSLMRTACPAHLILLYLIIVIIFGDEYKLMSSSPHITVNKFIFISNISQLLVICCENHMKYIMRLVGKLQRSECWNMRYT